MAAIDQLTNGKDFTQGLSITIGNGHAAPRDLKISGHTLIWTDWNSNVASQPASINGLNRSTGQWFHVTTLGQWFHVTTLAYGHFNPQLGPSTAVSGSIVVWTQTSKLASPTINFDIYGKNLATGQTFPITTDPRDQESPAISGTTVVWQDLRMGYGRIYGAALA